MRKDLFAHLQKLSYSYYDETKIGQLMARITSDLFDVTGARTTVQRNFSSPFKILVSFLILCNNSVLFDGNHLRHSPLMLLAAMYFNKRMRRAFKSQKSDPTDQAQGRGQPVGVRVVKSSPTSLLRTEKFAAAIESFLNIEAGNV